MRRTLRWLTRATTQGPGEKAALIEKFMHEAASATLESRAARPSRPWIQPRTLDLIELRNQARRAGRTMLEKHLANGQPDCAEFLGKGNRECMLLERVNLFPTSLGAVVGGAKRNA